MGLLRKIAGAALLAAASAPMRIGEITPNYASYPASPGRKQSGVASAKRFKQKRKSTKGRK